MPSEIVEFIAPQQFSEFFRELFTEAPVNYRIYTTVEEVHNLRKAEQRKEVWRCIPCKHQRQTNKDENNVLCQLKKISNANHTM